MKSRYLNNRNLARALFAFATLVLLSSALRAETPQVGLKDFTMTITGGSSLHDWESEVTELKIGGSLTVSEGTLSTGDSFWVEVPVLSIVSPHKRMDRLTYETLEAKRHPTIRYELESLKLLDEGKLRALGTLTIAGNEQPYEMDVQATVEEGGEVVVSGVAPLKITGFGMKPPSLMLGAVKVHDDVQINFTLTLNVNTNIK